MKFKSMLDRRVLYVLTGLAAACYVPVVIQDAVTYHSVMAESRTCCAFVSESRIERPVTYALVDEWSEPIWSENATRSERFLTSEGKVDGVTKFWRLLDRQPLSSFSELKFYSPNEYEDASRAYNSAFSSWREVAKTSGVDSAAAKEAMSVLTDKAVELARAQGNHRSDGSHYLPSR